MRHENLQARPLLPPSSGEAPLLNLVAPDWQKRARCRNMNQELFFPETGGGRNLKIVERACAECPVLKECREFTFAWESQQGTAPVGFVAGMGSTVRRRLYQRWRREQQQQGEAA